MSAQPQQKPRREYQKSGHHKRVRALKRRGFNAVNGQTYAGGQAKRWRAWAVKKKGGVVKHGRVTNLPPNMRHEIDLAMFDLWLLLELSEVIARDARQRGAVINRRRRELPKIHDQYNQVNQRFLKHCEALELEKGPNQLDLARRLMLENGGHRP